jgi:hypothetical protein
MRCCKWKIVCCLLMLAFSSAARGQSPDVKSDLAANAALQYWQAFSQMPSLEKEQRELLGEWSTVSLDDPAVVKLVEQSRMAVKYLHRGAKESRCDWGLDYSDGISLMLPHLAKARDLSLLAALHGRYEFERGNKRALRDDATAIMILGRHVGRDPILICILVRYVIEDAAIDLVAQTAPEMKAPYEQALAMYEKLPKAATVAQSMPIEREHMAGYVIRELTRVEQEKKGAWQELWTHLFAPDDRELAKQVTSFDQAIKLTKEILPHYESLERLAGLQKDEFDAQYPRFQAEQQTANPVAALLLPRLEKVMPKEYRHQARLALLLAAIAVADNGPDALKAIPDPFGKGPFEYRKTDGGFELKSQLEFEGKPVTLTVGKSKKQ